MTSAPRTRLNYTVTGSGPTLVLMHGVCNSSMCWAGLIQRLRDDYRIISIDMLGHGLSDHLTEEELDDPFGAIFATQADLLSYLYGEFGRLNLIGHSMGGALASALAAAHPEYVANLILADPAWLNDSQREQYVLNGPAAGQATIGWRTNPRGIIEDNCAKRSHWDSRDHIPWIFGLPFVDPGLVTTGIVSFSQPWQEVASALTCPTLIVTSDGEDCLLGQRGIDEINELGHPQLSPVLVPGLTHAIMPDNTEVFESLVRQQVATQSR